MTPTDTDHSPTREFWMTELVQSGMTLGEFTLPGTHDSACYGLQRNELSQISYSNIAFLWQLQPGPATFNGTYPWQGSRLCVGQPIYDLVMSTAYKTAHAQGHSIGRQLRHGIRYFDLRIYYDTNLQGFYTQHGLRGPALTSILDDVAGFLHRCQAENKEELIFLEFSHANFATLPNPSSYYTDQIIQLLQQTLGAENIYTPPACSNLPPPFIYDVSWLYTTPVSQITNGGPKVIVLNTDAPEYYYASVVVNALGFSDSNRSDDGTDSLTQLQQLEGAALVANQTANLPRLYKLDWTLTMQTTEILNIVSNALTGNSTGFQSLEQMSEAANYELENFLAQYPSCKFNLLFVNWFEKASTPKYAVARSRREKPTAGDSA